MSKSITLPFLLERFARVQKAISQWEIDESPEIFLSYGTAKFKIFADYLRKELESFFDSTADEGREVASNARPMVMAIDRFVLEYEALEKEIDSKRIDKGLVSMVKSDQFWRAYEGIVEVSRQQFIQRLPHPISFLIKSGVSYDQIGSIYGWFISTGVPDCQKVIEEHANPGTHYNPETWVDPGQRRRFELIDQEWSMRASKRKIKFVRHDAVPSPSPWKPISIEMMIAQKAPADQIAMVNGITIEKAHEMINEARTKEDSLAAV
ncbi:MAG: hypothetical protein ABL921_33335 [Pirellula sp.]